MVSNFVLRILRGQPGEQYWEDFELIRRPFLNVHSALLDVQKNPVNRDGVRVAPVVWESGCLEEVCGSCSMLINGRPRQGCSALIEPIIAETNSTTITLAPLSKFPLIRDLIVDRSSMFDNLKKVRGWIETDDSRDHGFGPKISPRRQEVMYSLSRCMTCGCCQEACPQVNSKSKFMGPAAVGQAHLFNIHPAGKFQKQERSRIMMQEGGVLECGKAFNCVVVCPLKIPLTDAISAVSRDVTVQSVKDLLGLPEVSEE